MKYHILFNPLAGNGNCKEKVQSLIQEYKENALTHDMTKIKNYEDFIASLEVDDVIILCGGDGTLNCFINDTDGITIQNDILYYASGTGNDFLKDVQVQDNGKPFSIKKYICDLPMVEVNGKQYRFLNNVGFGIDGYCCEVGDEMKKKTTKPINYTSIAIKGLLFHYKPIGATVVVDGKTYRYEKVWIAPTMKGRFYGGGMMPTPAQDRQADDASLSLMMFHGSSKLQTLCIFPSLFKGEHIKHKKFVTIHTGKDIQVSFDQPTALQIDGETISEVTSYHAMAKVRVTI